MTDSRKGAAPNASGAGAAPRSPAGDSPLPHKLQAADFDSHQLRDLLDCGWQATSLPVDHGIVRIYCDAETSSTIETFLFPGDTGDSPQSVATSVAVNGERRTAATWEELNALLAPIESEWPDLNYRAWIRPDVLEFDDDEPPDVAELYDESFFSPDRQLGHDVGITSISPEHFATLLTAQDWQLQEVVPLPHPGSEPDAASYYTNHLYRLTNGERPRQWLEVAWRHPLFVDSEAIDGNRLVSPIAINGKAVPVTTPDDLLIAVQRETERNKRDPAESPRGMFERFTARMMPDSQIDFTHAAPSPGVVTADQICARLSDILDRNDFDTLWFVEDASNTDVELSPEPWQPVQDSTSAPVNTGEVGPEAEL